LTLLRLYLRLVTITRRSVLTALSAAAVVKAQRQPPPNWKPKLGAFISYSDANLEFMKNEGFTSMELRLDPDKLDDAAIAAMKDKIAKSGLIVSSLGCDGNHIDPDPAKREKQALYTLKMIDLAGKLGVANLGGQSGTIPGQPLQQQVDEIERVYTERYFAACEKTRSGFCGNLTRVGLILRPVRLAGKRCLRSSIIVRMSGCSSILRIWCGR
jgi:hypothetical protein